jgi:hypothetical protein
MSARIESVEHVEGYVLDLRFSDGASGRVDLRDRIVGRGGVMSALEDIGNFRQVRVDSEAGTIVWPNGVDFCPDVLRHEATGEPLPKAPKDHRAA